MDKKRLIWILWPSFVVAGVAEVLFFTVFDPTELPIPWKGASLSRLDVYSVGFLLFWVFAAASSAFTCFLQRSAKEINRARKENRNAAP